MKVSSDFSSLNKDVFSGIKTNSNYYPARVADVILDETHPEYFKYGGQLSIGAIKFTPLGRQVDNADTSKLGIAFPSNPHFKSFPLVNEIVLLSNGPSPASANGRSTETIHYYTSVVNTWNSPSNPLPDSIFDDREVDLGYEYIDKEIKPLYPFHGDTILEGRNGQSIRLTGARSFKNPFTNKTNSGDPLTIISNGHVSNAEEDFHVENINTDLSSIYLTSNHLIPIAQSRDKYAGASERPVLGKNYEGTQIVLNSGRLFFNSTTNDILFSSQEKFGITANSVSIDGEKEIGLDAPKIYLGEKAVRFELEPIILGNQLELFLDTLLSELERLGNALTKAKTVDQKIIPTLNQEGPILKAYVKGLRQRINPNGESQLKSKKVYTE